MMRDYLARSAARGRRAQTYREHVEGVMRRATGHVQEIRRFSQGKAREWLDEPSLFQAAEYHDLGKLDEGNQQVLQTSDSQPLPYCHRDAGAALLGQTDETAALLIHAHHLPGLPNMQKQLGLNRADRFRNADIRAHTDRMLEQYRSVHTLSLGDLSKAVQSASGKPDALGTRLLLSCLVDADYSDAAGDKDERRIASRWQERLDRLDHYVHGKQGNSERDVLRREMYDYCRTRALEDSPVFYCDGPVGTGKTTAVMAALLRLAVERKLRHIIVVLPYTNLIMQTVNVLREALVLEDEQAYRERIVAEHHHHADYEDMQARQMASLWDAPIVVTTAVQFFESLAGSKPAKLRKIHQLPGSAIWMDESHAALPTRLYPLAWSWLVALAGMWGCVVGLSSGTMVRFWERLPFREHNQGLRIWNLLSDELSSRLAVFEKRRLAYHLSEDDVARATFRRMDDFIDFVCLYPGPRLIVMNTIISAARTAHAMKQRELDVLHLSTALSPVDREAILKRVVTRLENPSDQNWMLVATSCVEAGVNLSFHNGFREMCSVQSYFQTSGRICRHQDYGDSHMWNFILYDPLIQPSAQFKHSIHVLDKLIKSGRMAQMNLTETATEAFRMEMMLGQPEFEKLAKAERQRNFQDVDQCFNVIEDESYTVVVDQDIVKQLESGQSVTAQQLNRHSVRMSHTRLRELHVPLVHGYSEIYRLAGDKYDSDFLGYAKLFVES